MELRTISAQQFVQLAIESGRRLELNVAMVDARCDPCNGSGRRNDRPQILGLEADPCRVCGGHGSSKIAFPIFGTEYRA